MAKRQGGQRVFAGENLATISFPLGGIGTGYVGLTGIGGLRDWAVFNRPSFGGWYPRTFPVIWAKAQGEAPVARVLKGPEMPPFIGGGGGDPAASGEGLPHMDSCTFRGEYPFAWIDFASKALPVQVALEAYNPFIPSNADDSGYPAAILRYTVTNKTRKPVETTVAWSLFNLVGSIGEAEKDPNFRDVDFGFGQNYNEQVDEGGVRGLVFASKKWAEDHARFGQMALVTPDKDVTVLKYWKRAGWFTPMHDFWDHFSETGRFQERDYPPSEEKQSDPGAVGVVVKLKPGESKTATFYLTWYFPNFEKYWGEVPCCNSPSCCSGGSGKPKRHTWKNHYASQFSSALDVAQKLRANEKRLYDETKRFHDALFGSTLPAEVLDAVSSQMAILKTATVARLTDGTFYGFEGCAPIAGCCEGSCTHVWNYQQALPFLFPALERSMRSADYKYNFREGGSMCFRLQLPLGSKPNDFHPAADGQLGGIVKVYRDWKISGDDAWLNEVWPRAKAALEFAWKDWDSDRDGVVDGIQHNTYDIEFLGPNPLIAGFYLAALSAGAEMAEHLGDTDSARQYREVLAKGRAWIDANIFNGDYYVQRYDPAKAPEYQFGEGCLSDQVLGQWMARVAGLDYTLDAKHVRKALKAVYKHNFRRDLSAHANAQRVYALNDEAGLLMCSWPKGGRPAVPFPYSDEVWTGVEYQVASHLALEGMVDEAVAVVKAVRDRYDGRRRNPWDEFECGHHYARAMSSWGLVLGLSGFTYDKGARRIGFEPRVSADDFRTFWSLDGAWGTYEQRGKTATLTVLYGKLPLRRLDLPGFAGRTVKVDRQDAAVTVGADGALDLPKAVTLKPGTALTLRATR